MKTWEYGELFNTGSGFTFDTPGMTPLSGNRNRREAMQVLGAAGWEAYAVIGPATGGGADLSRIYFKRRIGE